MYFCGPDIRLELMEEKIEPIIYRTHQRTTKKIKAMAALTGTSIPEYVVSRFLPASSDEEVALKELETLFNKLIKFVKAGQVSRRTLREIFQEV